MLQVMEQVVTMAAALLAASTSVYTAVLQRRSLRESVAAQSEAARSERSRQLRHAAYETFLHAVDEVDDAAEHLYEDDDGQAFRSAVLKLKKLSASIELAGPPEMVRYADDVNESCGGTYRLSVAEAPQQRAWRRLRELRSGETHLVNGASGQATTAEAALAALMQAAEGGDDTAMLNARTDAAAALNELSGLTFEDKEELLLDAMSPDRRNLIQDREQLRARLATARSRFYEAARPYLGTHDC